MKPLPIPHPTKLDLPSKFKEWRPGQEEAIQAFLSRSEVNNVIVQPPGSGKSLSYMAAAWMTGRSTVVLTSTKALQDQLTHDFGETKTLDIRGQSSFKCDIDPKHTVDMAPCRTGDYDCEFLKEGEYGEPPSCEYFRRLYDAKRKQIIVTNYYWWFSYIKYLKGTVWDIGQFDAIVLDEAHNALDSLYSFLQIRLEVARAETVTREEAPQVKAGEEEWSSWAARVLPKVTDALARARERLKGGEFTPESYDKARNLYRLQQEINAISQIHGEWAIHEVGDRIHLDPTHLDDETTHNYLFGDIKYRYLTSATIRPHTIKMLGIKDYAFLEGDSVFPVERRPVTHIKTLKVDYKTPVPRMVDTWVKTIDDILKHRRDRKGIIHTVSYDRAKLLAQHSEYKDFMYLNKSWNLTEIVQAFKETHVPAILVSPAVTQGYDFPYEECQYQIIGKVPFPHAKDPAMVARAEDDPLLPHYMAMQKMVQMSGRGMRAEDDFCEVFIVDDHIEWFLKRHRALAPEWWHESITLGRQVPPRPSYRLDGSVLPADSGEELNYV